MWCFYKSGYNKLHLLTAGQDRSLRMTSTIRDAQSCEISQGILDPTLLISPRLSVL